MPDMMTDKERRLREQNQALQKKFNLSSVVQFTANRFGPLVFAMTIGVVGMYFAVMSFAATPETSGHAANLSLEPSARQVGQGQTMTVRLWADSLDQPVNVVEAHLAYQPDRFEFVGIDAASSAFTLDRQTQQLDGRVIVSRSTDQPEGLIGRQLVAKVTFRAKSGAATSPLSSMWFDDNSRLLRVRDQADILKETSGGDYRISAVR